jgi:hypothetical protein
MQIDFFADGGADACCDVQDGDAGIMFVNRADGRATGDAFVRFGTEQVRWMDARVWST